MIFDTELSTELDFCPFFVLPLQKLLRMDDQVLMIKRSIMWKLLPSVPKSLVDLPLNQNMLAPCSTLMRWKMIHLNYHKPVLGPLFFFIYVNNITKSSQILSFILFADDTNLFFNHKELKQVTLWLNANKLLLMSIKHNSRFLKQKRGS